MTLYLVTEKKADWANLKVAACPFCCVSTSVNRRVLNVRTSSTRMYLFWCEHCGGIGAVRNRIRYITAEEVANEFPDFDADARYYSTRLLNINGFTLPTLLQSDLPLEVLDLYHTISSIIYTSISENTNNVNKSIIKNKCGEIKFDETVTKLPINRGFGTFIKVNDTNLSNSKYVHLLDFFKLRGPIYLSFANKYDEIACALIVNERMPWFAGDKTK